MTKSNQNIGVLFALLSTLLYSLGGLFVKGVPWDGLALNAGRSLISIFVYVIFLIVTRHKLRINKWILFGALNIGVNNTTFTLANKMTSAGNTVVLQFTAPIFVIIFSAIFLKKRPKKIELLTCLAAGFGIVLFFIESIGGGNLIGDFIALFNGMLYGITFMLNDMPDSDPITSVFLGAVIGVVIGFPGMLTMMETAPLAGTALINMLLLGVAQTGLAYVFLVLSMARNTPAITTSLISGLQPVLSPILVAVVYGEMMGPLSLVGAAIVILSVLAYNVIKARQDSTVHTAVSEDDCEAAATI